MNVQPKAVFLDMDGTVLNHYNQVSEKTQRVIAELRSKNILVFIATGRTKNEFDVIVPANLEVDGIVTANGMIVYVGEKLVSKKTLPIRLIEELVEKARDNKMYYEVHPVEGQGIILSQDRNYTTEEIRGPKPESVGINEWISREEAIEGDILWQDELVVSNSYTKLYFFNRDQDSIEKWKQTLEELKSKESFTTSTSSNHNVEVMAANANKATGIQSLLDYFNISAHEAIAIGDSNNDIPMFELVGHAVAMNNASDMIKEIADEVTDYTCDNDGVYHYLKTKLLVAEG